MEIADVTTQACQQLDPRIRRTRQLLLDALNRLLAEKEFDKISIQDLTDAATLNRATFYAHYPDKFALLEQLIRVSFLELLAQRKVRFDGTCSSAFQAIILAVCDYLADLQNRMQKGVPERVPERMPERVQERMQKGVQEKAQKSLSIRQHQFEPFVEATVIDQLRLILMQGFREHPVAQGIPQEIIAATASWAIYGAAKQWVNTPHRAPAEEFVAVAVNLVQPILLAGAAPIPSRESHL